MRGDIQDYARAAAGHLTAGGVFACIFPTSSALAWRRLPGTLNSDCPAAPRGVPRRTAAAGRVVCDDAGVGSPPAMNRTWIEPPLVIRTADGTVHPEYAAVKLAVGFPP